jgi:hypothetical protein
MAVSQSVNGRGASCISGFENPLGSCFTLTHNTQNSDAAENSKSTLCGILNYLAIIRQSIRIPRRPTKGRSLAFRLKL